jgi:hypothetical protein
MNETLLCLISAILCLFALYGFVFVIFALF